jgi:rod shape determining protein RodA
VLAPVGLVLIQPNLGIATLMALSSAFMFYLAGVRLWKFMLLGAAMPFAAWAAWAHLHDYQKKRLLTFLDPEDDPLGSGYNIIQSKIALGSGGLFGKGFGMGTQSQLNFLPEKHTDFIFVLLAEEFGLVGAALLLTLFICLIVYGFIISLNARHQYGRLLGIGITLTFFLYVLTNVAMVTGLIPVVGIPLPLISYGGSVMLAFYGACGLLLSIAIHKDARFGRNNID